MKAISILCGLAALSLSGEARLSAADGSAVAASPVKIDLNNADLSSLEAVPEIGARFAPAVIAARPFKSAEELQRILKLSPEHVPALLAKVTVLPPRNAAALPKSPGVTPAVATGQLGPGAALASEQERAEARRRHIRRDGRLMTEPPPPRREETKPESPGSNYVWRAGHWSPVKGEWTWMPGEWAVPPTSISVWIDGAYDAKEKRWSPGYWEPDTVRVAEPVDGEKR